MLFVYSVKGLNITKIFMSNWRDWKINIADKKLFPKQLLTLKNLPNKLYYRGNWNNEIFDKTIVIVGSRKMTKYGQEIINKFMPDIVSKNITVVSGFMYGVDSQAHNECVELGGKTVAVLGSGLNYLATSDNDKLYTKILESGGIVISEYEADFKATRWSFPQRNRIVAGLATIGVLVVEAGMKSGSLITARLGKENGKSVFSIPGAINSASSAGCNWLIKNNKAKIVTEIGDILAGVKSEQIKLFPNDLTEMESRVYKLLELEPLTIDELVKKSKFDVSQISIAISTLTLKNMINEENGILYLN